ncbi:hypothetical protein GQ607_001131 [Colletotrichum asianum]|uniref:Uncharacterized protein n=1 Tax=Colletotrichum asianum TaxID=702518 RepID=A0A8H3WR82_9PEZI|nr:hypothetical protein GQ607_001131 [Colletotrichum asianum]
MWAAAGEINVPIVLFSYYFRLGDIPRRTSPMFQTVTVYDCQRLHSRFVLTYVLCVVIIQTLWPEWINVHARGLVHMAETHRRMASLLPRHCVFHPSALLLLSCRQIKLDSDLRQVKQVQLQVL